MISGPNAKEYDLVLMDHFMPLCGGELTGEETIPVIRPFIKGIIAGSSGNDMRKEHTAAGADLFWLKPVPKDDNLLEDLREAFRLTRLSGSKWS
jgi:CheY-like chemotaxis protein